MKSLLFYTAAMLLWCTQGIASDSTEHSTPVRDMALGGSDRQWHHDVLLKQNIMVKNTSGKEKLISFATHGYGGSCEVRVHLYDENISPVGDRNWVRTGGGCFDFFVQFTVPADYGYVLSSNGPTHSASEFY
jgi:hypothetical protein